MTGTLEKPVNWKPGAADEPWKLMICARDAARAQDIIHGLAYILGGRGSSMADAANAVRQFSGDQIADALLTYHSNNFLSVVNGLAAASAKGDAE